MAYEQIGVCKVQVPLFTLLKKKTEMQQSKAFRNGPAHVTGFARM